ncbi:MAG: hypothetical protein K1X66_03605 [Verrucomicrobiae bacterium]|nr:hypothetical protein [Verrucomicrobiae bacterium]
MKNAMIFAKKSTWKARLDIDYLDETSQLKQRNRPKEFITGQKLRQFSDYASKETVGQVYPGGFFHFKVGQNNDGTFTSPSLLSNEERKKRITQSWHEHLKRTSGKGKVIQHRMVFSMSKEMHDALVKASLNPDSVLHRSMKQVMRQFQEKFHPGDSIGYAYGIHHDTDNLHVHVALCPRTKEGRYVGCSTPKNLKHSKHRDQMGYIRKCFEVQNRKWEEILKNPEKLVVSEKKSMFLRTDKLFFSPRLGSQELIQLQNSQNIQAFQLQQTYKRLQLLRAYIEEDRRRRTQRANLNFMQRLTGIKKPIALKVIEKMSKAVKGRQSKKMYEQLHQLRKYYLSQYRNYQKLYGEHYASKNAYYYPRQAQYQARHPSRKIS